jgi:hypothetical protein
MDTTRSEHPNAGRFQPGGILALSVSHFIHDVYSGFLSPLLPLLIEKLSMSLTQAGLLSTVMQIPHLANPYIGMTADRRVGPVRHDGGHRGEPAVHHTRHAGHDPGAGH